MNATEAALLIGIYLGTVVGFFVGVEMARHRARRAREEAFRRQEDREFQRAIQWEMGQGYLILEGEAEDYGTWHGETYVPKKYGDWRTS